LIASSSRQCLPLHIIWSLRSITSMLWPAHLHLFLLTVHIISHLIPSSSLQCLPLHIFFWSLHSTMSLLSLWPARLHLFLLRVLTISTLLPSSSLQRLPLHIVFWSLHSIMSMLWPVLLYLLLLCVHANSTLLLLLTFSSYWLWAKLVSSNSTFAIRHWTRFGNFQYSSPYSSMVFTI
jgi:hypothetical protein